MKCLHKRFSNVFIQNYEYTDFGTFILYSEKYTIIVFILKFYTQDLEFITKRFQNSKVPKRRDLELILNDLYDIKTESLSVYFVIRRLPIFSVFYLVSFLLENNSNTI